MITIIRLNNYWSLEIERPYPHLKSIIGRVVGQVNGYPFIKYDRFNPRGEISCDWPEHIPKTIKSAVQRKLNAYVKQEMR